MRVLRALLVAATLIAVVATPVLIRGAASSTRPATGYDVATSEFDPIGRVYAQGNRNGNGNGNDNGRRGNDNGGGGNDNGGNDNGGNDNRRKGNGNGNGNDNFVAGPAATNVMRDAVRKCFDVEEVGVLQLILPGGDVTLTVPPNVGFPVITDVTMRRVEPSTQPGVPGTLVDNLMWAIDGQSGCGGPGLGVLGNDYNLGITYHVPADKSRVRIMRLSGGTWTEVNTVPDPAPANPYVSTTSRDVGIFAIVQR